MEIKTVNSSTSLEREEKVIIKAPEGAMYLSEFMTELPIGILNKSDTGCGATSVALENNQNTIICCPTKQLIINKVNQYPMERCSYKLLGVIEGISTKDIHNYIIMCKRTNQPIKIMVTYDSFYKVKDAIGVEISEYSIIVDEYQELLDIITYRGKAILNFLSQVKGLLKVTYVSATPIPFSYRPNELLGLNEYEIDWGKEGRLKPIRRFSYRPYASVVKIIKRHKNGHPLIANDYEVMEYYFFINSVTAIKNIIENAGLSDDEVKVICSDSYTNRKTLGNISISNVSDENKTFTFCTKTVFCGADFNSESGLIIIVSEGKNKNTMLDIATDIQQIAGRIRNINNPFKNIILHIYNKGISGMTKENFDRLLSKKIDLANKKISAYNQLPDDLKVAITASISMDDNDELAYFDEENKSVRLNEIKISNLNYKFNAIDSVYKNGLSIREAYLKNGFDVSIAEKYEKVAEEFIDFVTKPETYKELIEEYYYERGRSNFGKSDRAIEIERLNKNIPDAYAQLKIEDIRKQGYNSTRIRNLAISKSKKVKEAISTVLDIKLKVGERYTNKIAKEILHVTYESLLIKVAPKATDVKNYFEIKKVKIQSEGRRVDGIEIIGRVGTVMFIYQVKNKYLIAC